MCVPVSVCLCVSVGGSGAAHQLPLPAFQGVSTSPNPNLLLASDNFYVKQRRRAHQLSRLSMSQKLVLISIIVQYLCMQELLYFQRELYFSIAGSLQFFIVIVFLKQSLMFMIRHKKTREMFRMTVTHRALESWLHTVPV